VGRRRRDRTSEQRRAYREHVGAVYGFFAYSLSGPSAEDLTSATFERVIRAWDSYDPGRASERAWVMAIARNLLIDFYRRESLRRTVSTDQHPELLARLSLESPQERVLEAATVAAWLEPLSERDRQVVALRYGADLQAKEIAELVELSPANVHQILSRSLRRLRELEEARRVSDNA